MDKQDVIAFISLLDTEKTVSIDLSNKDIDDLPPEIGNFTNLKFLNLSYNNLVSLPDEICKLSNLQTLLLLRNELIELPENFSNLKKLELLDISYNQISKLPANFEKLSLLNSLDASYNMLKILPMQFVKLYNLKELHLEQNPFEYPPYNVIKRGLYATMYFLTEEKKKQNAARVSFQILNMPEIVQPIFEQYIDAFNDVLSTYEINFNFDMHYANPEIEHKIEISDKTVDFLHDFVVFIKENIQTIKSAESKKPELSLFESHVRDLKKQISLFNTSLDKKMHEMKAIKTKMEFLSKMIEE
jgi:hypothetical protein